PARHDPRVAGLAGKPGIRGEGHGRRAREEPGPRHEVADAHREGGGPARADGGDAQARPVLDGRPRDRSQHDGDETHRDQDQPEGPLHQRAPAGDLQRQEPHLVDPLDPWTLVETAHGFRADELISTFQKSIRRGLVENAALVAYELYVTSAELEEHLW